MSHWLIIAFEVIACTVLAYLLTTYAFLSFWAYKLPFNDAIAVATILASVGASAAVIYAADRVGRQILGDDSA